VSKAALTGIAASALLPVGVFREAHGVPALGIIGPEAIREAFEGDLRQLQDLLQGKLKALLQRDGEEHWWPHIHGLFSDVLVVEGKDGKLWRYSYSVDGTEVTLGTPEEVRKDFVPVETASSRDRVAEAAILEAADQASGVWRIRIIRAGLSTNGNYYPDAALREAVPLFEKARVFVKSDQEHLAGGGKDFRNLVGALSDVTFVEGAAPDTGELQGSFKLLEPEGDVAVRLREAWSRGMTDLFGFSIDAEAVVAKRKRNGRAIREAVQFRKVKSVDLIVEPGAGGAVIDLIESTKEYVMDRETIVALLEAKGILKKGEADGLTLEQLTERLTEAVGTAKADDDGGEDGGDGGSAGGTASLAEAVRLIETRSAMREAVNASSLPAAAKRKVIDRLAAMESFTEADVTKAIKDEGEYLATFTESGAVRGLGARVEPGQSRSERVADMLDAFFDPSHADHRQAQSFRECYIEITGDRRVTGMLRECDEAKLREALDSSSFDDVLGNSITRRMIRDYNTPGIYDVWRQLGNVVPVGDFRTQERTRFGGYGDLPAVSESDPYAALTSPSDEKATYAVTKRGGVESVTLEMIKNDDVGVIRQIPTRLSRSAKRTLAKFVLDFLATNPVIYNSQNLFHGDHGNLGTAALDATTLAARRLAMLKQAEAGSGDRLGIGPKYLWVPPDLEETAVNLFRRNTQNDKTFTQSLTLEVMPVWYWTDTNNWYLTADPMDIPGVEIGFLDGQEEPELFVQDSPTGGSMFSHDQLTWKIRHIYGGAVKDFRFAQGSVVA
jgi:hypothetical protein